MASRKQDSEAEFVKLASSDIDWRKMQRPTQEDQEFFKNMQIDPEKTTVDWKKKRSPEEVEEFDSIIEYYSTQEKEEMAGLRAMREKQNSDVGGLLQTCMGGCGGEGKLRCKGCFMVTYCGVECQRKAWKRHKAPCKRARALYRPVRLSHKSGEMSMADMRKVMQNQVSASNPPLKPSRSQFVVKVSLGQHSMFLMNEEGSVNGSLFRNTGQEELYDCLKIQIMARGFQRRKAFFSAIYKSDSYEEGCQLEINPAQTLPVEIW